MVMRDLSQTAEGTRLTLTHQSIETFIRHTPVYSRDARIAGCRYFLHQRLKAFVERQACYQELFTGSFIMQRYAGKMLMRLTAGRENNV